MDLQGFTTIDEVGDDDDISKEVSINLAIPKNFPSTAAEEIDFLNRLLDDIEKNGDCNNKITSNGISPCKDKAELLIQSGVKFVLNKFNSLGLESVTNFYNNNMDKVDIDVCVDSNGKIEDSGLIVNSTNTSIGQIESTSGSEKLSLVHEGLISDGNLVDENDKNVDLSKTNEQICCVLLNNSVISDDSLCNSTKTDLNLENEIDTVSIFSHSINDAALQTATSKDSNSIGICGSFKNSVVNKTLNIENDEEQLPQNLNIEHYKNFKENKTSSKSYFEALEETEQSCVNILNSQIVVEAISEEFSELSKNKRSFDENDDSYINISLPLKIIQIKSEPQEMEEEFDFGDFLHDPAEEFNLDAVKEEQGGDSAMMETFSIDTENVETKPEPCDGDDIEQEYQQCCYIPHIHYLVKDNENYSKEQVTAALLMSQSSLAKVIDMEMFSNLGQTFPITSLYKLEYLADDLQILPFRDKDLIDNFFQMYGSNPRRWAKFFKFKRKYKKRKDKILPDVTDKSDNALDNGSKLAIQNKKVEALISISNLVVEKNLANSIKPINFKQRKWSKHDKQYMEESRKNFETIFDRTVSSSDLLNDSDYFYGFVKDPESQTQFILEKLTSRLKHLQSEPDNIVVVSPAHFNKSDSEDEITKNAEIICSKQYSSHKKVKDKHEFNYKHNNSESKYNKKSDKGIKGSDSEKEPKHRKENDRVIPKWCIENSEFMKVKETFDKKKPNHGGEKHLHKSKSSVKLSKAILGINEHKYFEKKYIKYDRKLLKKYKLKNCYVAINTDTKFNIFYYKMQNPMPERKRRNLIINYVQSVGYLEDIMLNCREPILLKSSYDAEDISSDKLEMSGKMLHKKIFETSMPKKMSNMDFNSKQSFWEEFSDSKSDVNSCHQVNSPQSAGSDKQESIQPVDSQYSIMDISFENVGLFSDTSSISINEELCEQLKEIDNILNKDLLKPKSLSPSKSEFAIQYEVGDSNIGLFIKKCENSKSVSSDPYAIINKMPINNKGFKDKKETKDSLQKDITEKENSWKLSKCIDENNKLSVKDENNLVHDIKTAKTSKSDSSDDLEIVHLSDSEISTNSCSQDSFEKKNKSVAKNSDQSNLIIISKVAEHLSSSSLEEKKISRECHVSLMDISKDKLYRKKIRREKKWLFKHGKLQLPQDNNKVGPLSSKPIVVKKDAFEDILSKAMDKIAFENVLKKKTVHKEKEPSISKDQVSLLENKKSKQKNYLEDVRLKMFREGFGKRPITTSTDSNTKGKMESNNIPEEVPIFGAAFRIPKKVVNNNENHQEKKEPLSLLQRKEEKSTSYYNKDIKYHQSRYGRGLQDIDTRNVRVANTHENMHDRSIPGRNDLNKTYSNSETSKPLAENITNLHRPIPNNFNLQNQFSVTPNTEGKTLVENIIGNQPVKVDSTAAAFVCSYMSSQFSATRVLNINTDNPTDAICDKGSKIPVVINYGSSSKHENLNQPTKFSFSDRRQSGPCTPEYNRPPSVDNDQYDDVNDDGFDLHSSDSPINSPSETNASTSLTPQGIETLTRHKSPQIGVVRKISASLKNCLKPYNSPKSNEMKTKIMLQSSYSPVSENTAKLSVKAQLISSYSPNSVKICESSENHSLKMLPDLHFQSNKSEINSPIIKQLYNKTENKSVADVSENVSSLDRESQRKAELVKKLDPLDKKGQIRLYEKYKSLYNSAKKDFYDDTSDLNRNLVKQKKFKALHHYRKLYYDLKIYLCELKKSSHEIKMVDLPGMKESKEQINIIAPHNISLSPIDKLLSCPVHKAVFEQSEKESLSPKDSDPYSPSGSPVLARKVSSKKTSVSDPRDSYHAVNSCNQQIMNNKLSNNDPKPVDAEDSESTIKDIISSFFVDRDKKIDEVIKIPTSVLEVQEKPVEIPKSMSNEQIMSCDDNDDVNAPYSPSGSPVFGKKIFQTFDTKDTYSEYLNLMKTGAVSSKSKSISKLSSDIMCKVPCTNKEETLNMDIDKTTLLNLQISNFVTGDDINLNANRHNNLEGQNFSVSLNSEAHKSNCKTTFQKHIVDAYEVFSIEIDSVKAVDEGELAVVSSPVYSSPGSPLLVENVCGSFLSYVPPETKEALIATKLELAKETSFTYCVGKNNSDRLSDNSESSIEDVVMDDAEVVVEVTSSMHNKVLNNSEVWNTEVIQNIMHKPIGNDHRDKSLKIQPPVSISSSISLTTVSSGHESTLNSSFNSLPLLSVPTLPNVNIPPPQYLPSFGAPSASKPSGVLGVVVEDVEPSAIGAVQKSNDQPNVDFKMDLSLATSLLLTPPPPPLYSPPAMKLPIDTTKNIDPYSTCVHESNVASQSEKKSAFSDLISEFFQKWEEPPSLANEQQSDFEIVYSKVQEKAVKPLQDAWVYYSEPPLAQVLIDKVEMIPLVGLQYILEVQKEPTATVETCSYICSLCSKKMSTATLLAHVKSVPHRLKYTECHSKEIDQKYGKLEVKQWTATLVKEFTTALDNLEKNTGRQSMAIVKESKMNSGINFLKNKVQMALKDIEHGSNESGKGSSSSLTNGCKGNISSDRTKSSSTVVDITKSPLDRFKRPGESPRLRPLSDRSDKGKGKASPRPSSSNRYSRDRDGKSKDVDRSRDNDRVRDSVRSRDGKHSRERSRDRERHGDSYKKDRRHSSDKSSTLSNRRSRSRSPVRHDHRSQERSSNAAEERRIKDFRVEESRLKAQHDKEMERYTSDPESHPRYKAEWGKFWEKHSREIEQQGRDPRYYDFKKDWILYWKMRMTELGDLEFQAQRKEYLMRHRVEDPDKNKKSTASYSYTDISKVTPIKSDVWTDPSVQYNKLNSGHFGSNCLTVKNESVQKHQQPLSPWERNHSSDKSYMNTTSSFRQPYEMSFSVVGTLKLLTDLEDQLGSLAPVAKALLKKAIDITENGGRPLELFGDNDNLVVLRLSNVKLTSQVNSGILDAMAAARTQMAIESTNWLLKEAEKYCTVSSDKNPSHMLGLDLKLIAKATIGMDTVKVAMYIAQQLLNIGKSDANEAELQQILYAVSAHHLQLKTENEIAISPASQHIGEPQAKLHDSHLSYPNYNKQNYPSSNKRVPYPIQSGDNTTSSSVPALFPAGAQKADTDARKGSFSEAPKSGLTLLQTAYEDNSCTDMDKLSLKDLQELLSNYNNLNSEKQQALTEYLKKLEATDSKKVTKLRAMVHHSNKPQQPPPKSEVEEKMAESYHKEQLRVHATSNINNEPLVPLKTSSEYMSQSLHSPPTESKEFGTSPRGNLFLGGQRESASNYFQTSGQYDYKGSLGKSNEYASFSTNNPPRDMPKEREYPPPESNRYYSSMPGPAHYQDFNKQPESAATSSFRELSSIAMQFSDSSFALNKDRAKPNAPPTDLYPPRSFGRPATSTSYISESFRNFDTGLSLERPTSSFRSDYNSGFQQGPESSYDSREFFGESSQNFENNGHQTRVSNQPNQTNRFPSSNFPERGGMHPTRAGFRGPRFRH